MAGFAPVAGSPIASTRSDSTPASVFVIGLQASAQVGQVYAYSPAVHLIGLEADAQLGVVDARVIIPARVTGLTAVTGLGDATVTSVSISANVSVLGLQARALLNTVSVWGLVNDRQDPNWIPVRDDQADNWIPVKDEQEDKWVPVLTD
jgi:hypothetical protein